MNHKITSSLQRRGVLAALTSMGLSSAWAQRAASAYPIKPIRLIVGFPAGGPVDLMGRVVADVLSKALSQAVVVENKAGAGGAIGSDLVAKARPDGYTLGIGPISSLSIAPAAGLRLPYNVETDFTWLSMLGKIEGVIIAHPDAPFNDLASMVSYAKTSPGKLIYASSGLGTSSHLAAEVLSMRAGIQMTHVPYKGSAPAVQDLLGGQVPVYFDTSLVSAGQLAGGKKVKAIAITGPRHSPLLPGVKTVAELGFPGFDVSPWLCLMGPAGMDATIIDQLNKLITVAMHTPEVAARLAVMGGFAETSSPEENRAFVLRDIAQWSQLIKTAKLKLE